MQFLENALAEIHEAPGMIRNFTHPSFTFFLLPGDKRAGMVITVCAGGGYGTLYWKTHAE